MAIHQVGYLIGSLAKNSINRKLAKALVPTCSAPPQDAGNPLQGPSALQL